MRSWKAICFDISSIILQSIHFRPNTLRNCFRKTGHMYRCIGVSRDSFVYNIRGLMVLLMKAIDVRCWIWDFWRFIILNAETYFINYTRGRSYMAVAYSYDTHRSCCTAFRLCNLTAQITAVFHDSEHRGIRRSTPMIVHFILRFHPHGYVTAGLMLLSTNAHKSINITNNPKYGLK